MKKISLPMLNNELKTNLQRLQERIASACKSCGRAAEQVTLLPVTKQQPLSKLEALYEMGFRSFGENRVQEMQDKAVLLPADIEWHLIGSLQTNKVRAALKYAACIHSIDSFKLIERVARIAAEEQVFPAVFLQVNLTGEQQKGGFAAAELAEALRQVSLAGNLKLKGLMTMSAVDATPEQTGRVFRELRLLREQYQTAYPGLTELSMGMSDDFELAILEGATYIRIGSLLLGERNKQ